MLKQKFDETRAMPNIPEQIKWLTSMSAQYLWDLCVYIGDCDDIDLEPTVDENISYRFIPNEKTDMATFKEFWQDFMMLTENGAEGVLCDDKTKTISFAHDIAFIEFIGTYITYSATMIGRGKKINKPLIPSANMEDAFLASIRRLYFFDKQDLETDTQNSSHEHMHNPYSRFTYDFEDLKRARMATFRDLHPADPLTRKQQEWSHWDVLRIQ